MGVLHTLSKHNQDALLNGPQHRYAWRVYMKEREPYWYHNTAYLMEPYFFVFISPTCSEGVEQPSFLTIGLLLPMSRKEVNGDLTDLKKIYNSCIGR